MGTGKTGHMMHSGQQFTFEIDPHQAAYWTYEVGNLALMAAVRGADCSIRVDGLSAGNGGTATVIAADIAIDTQRESLRLAVPYREQPELFWASKAVGKPHSAATIIDVARTALLQLTKPPDQVQRLVAVSDVALPSYGLMLEDSGLLPVFCIAAQEGLSYICDPPVAINQLISRSLMIHMSSAAGKLQPLGSNPARIYTRNSNTHIPHSTFDFKAHDPETSYTALLATTTRPKPRPDSTDLHRPPDIRSIYHGPEGCGFLYRSKTNDPRRRTGCEGSAASIVRIFRSTWALAK